MPGLHVSCSKLAHSVLAAWCALHGVLAWTVPLNSVPRPLCCTVLEMLASPHAKSPGAHSTEEYTRRSHAATVTCLVPQGIPTVPSLLGDEKATNPFLRPSDPHIRAHLGFGADAPDWKVFGAIRSAKDTFRG